MILFIYLFIFTGTGILFVLSNFLLLNGCQHQSRAYRDRAAERRALHGAFGVGPGQKSSVIVDTDSSSPPVFGFTEQAAAEALNMSFGAHSYARRMLENMGWKEVYSISIFYSIE